MRRLRCVLFVLSLMAAVLPARALRAAGLLQEAEFYFDATTEWGMETGTGRTPKLDLELEPGFQAELLGQVRLSTLGRFHADPVDDLEPGKPAQVSVAPATRRLLGGYRAEFELREFYIDVLLEGWLLRAGKQQVVWGQADGLKVLDVVNPQTFREFILDEFEDSRTPLWTLNLEGPLFGGMDLQLLWIPDPTYHELPEPGARFAFPLPVPPPGVELVLEEPDRPRRYLKDSDAGARLSAFWGGWDLGLYYLYHYDDFPTLSRSVEIGPMGPQLRITPKYERTHLFGASGSNAFGDLTLRTEMGYFTRHFFAIDDLSDSDGLAESGELGYVVGLDWSGFPETLVSGQLFQTWVTGHAQGLRRDRVETNVSLLVQREFLNDILVFSLLWIHGINEADGLVRPRLQYEFSNSVNGWIGFDVFYGRDQGIFGQFDQRDRMVIGFEWGYGG